jgi:hypothetical protein
MRAITYNFIARPQTQHRRVIVDDLAKRVPSKKNCRNSPGHDGEIGTMTEKESVPRLNMEID